MLLQLANDESCRNFHRGETSGIISSIYDNSRFERVEVSASPTPHFISERGINIRVCCISSQCSCTMLKAKVFGKIKLKAVYNDT